MSKKVTQEEFIQKAINKHGDKYNYLQVQYINSTTKVNIVCKKHGIFTQAPNKHLYGRGCRHCSGENTAKRLKSSTEEFIKKAREVHGDKYDYSKVDYVNNSTNVIIGCEVHGDFEQRPHIHMSGANCGKCSDLKTSIATTRTTEEFIEKCKEVYNDAYDYSLIDYKNCKEGIKIICKTHGIFEVTGDVFLNNADGCKKCSHDRQVEKAKENFIEKSKILHENKYDYSLVSYINNKTKVEIICPTHGVFLRTPASHALNFGCDICKHGTIENLKTEQFIEKSKTLHNKYNYDKTIYVSAKTKVILECPEHGYFTINPINNLGGNGCKKCASIERGKKLLGNTSNFIERSIKKHGDRYDYSLVDYKHSRKAVKILCDIHGIFEQEPTTHLLGKGCKQCSNLVNIYKREDYIKLAKEATLYLLKVFKDEEVFYKIGKTKNTVKQRFSSTNINPYSYELVHEYKSEIGEIFDLEIELHKKYYKHKYKPNYKFSGYGECYTMELPIKEISNI